RRADGRGALHPEDLRGRERLQREALEPAAEPRRRGVDLHAADRDVGVVAVELRDVLWPRRPYRERRRDLPAAELVLDDRARDGDGRARVGEGVEIRGTAAGEVLEDDRP